MPAEVEAAVATAMAKDPDRRFASAADFAAALESRRVASAGAAGWRRSSLVAPAAAVVVVVAVGLLLARFCAG
ncbi:MAG: hypothetical protein GWN71_20600 [Gammaproteobacteria bacterium]|nr:hypothetical protein [Gammaproteobacteria bacterium]